MKTTFPQLGFGLRDSGAGSDTLTSELKNQKFGRDFILVSKEEGNTWCNLSALKRKKRVIIIMKGGILGEGETVYKHMSCAHLALHRGAGCSL